MKPTRSLSTLLVTAAWTLGWLAVLDVTVQLALRPLAARHPDSSLVRYFEYGQSIEGKLDRMTRLAPGAFDALILKAGWLDPAQWRDLPRAPAANADLLVAAYGQSFAMNATAAAAGIDGRLSVRGIGGPAAPPDHSYAAYCMDEDNRGARVVVFGILASAVPHMGSMSGLDWTFEHPAPFTFPHYRLDGARLVPEWPLLRTEQQFREAFAARSSAWLSFKEQLARNDRGFDRLAFDRSPADASQVALLLRRAWVAHSQGDDAGVLAADGAFVPDSEPIRVLQAMLADLQSRTRARGQRLIVLLEHDRGFGDSLHRALGPTLDAQGIAYVSTDTLFSANDPRNFQPDGHYTPEANERLARRLQALIRATPAGDRPPLW